MRGGSICLLAGGSVVFGVLKVFLHEGLGSYRNSACFSVSPGGSGLADRGKPVRLHLGRQ
jgi:hypothetical protein